MQFLSNFYYDKRDGAQLASFIHDISSQRSSSWRVSAYFSLKFGRTSEEELPLPLPLPLPVDKLPPIKRALNGA